MKRLVLGLLMFSTLILGKEIVNTAVGCYNKSDALPANIARMIGNTAVVNQYKEQKKCYSLPPHNAINIKILNTNYSKLGTGGKVINIQYDVMSINGNKFNAGDLRLWSSMEYKTYKQFPFFK